MKSLFEGFITRYNLGGESNQLKLIQQKKGYLSNLYLTIRPY